MASNYGTACIYGISGSISKIGGTSIAATTYGYALLSSQKTRKNFDVDMFVDQHNEVIGLTQTKKRLEADIVFIPKGVTGGTDTTAVCQALVALIPASASYITLADMNDSSFNGDFNILEAMEVDSLPNGRASVTLRCVQYEAISATNLATIKP